MQPLNLKIISEILHDNKWINFELLWFRFDDAFKNWKIKQYLMIIIYSILNLKRMLWYCVIVCFEGDFYMFAKMSVFGMRFCSAETFLYLYI